MRTVEGDEIKLGEITLMPVKEKQLTDDDAFNLFSCGVKEKKRVLEITPLKDDGIKIFKNPLFCRWDWFGFWTYKYYNKKIKMVKPANYKD